MLHIFCTKKATTHVPRNAITISRTDYYVSEELEGPVQLSQSVAWSRWAGWRVWRRWHYYEGHFINRQKKTLPAPKQKKCQTLVQTGRRMTLENLEIFWSTFITKKQLNIYMNRVKENKGESKLEFWRLRMILIPVTVMVMVMVMVFTWVGGEQLICSAQRWVRGSCSRTSP